MKNSSFDLILELKGDFAMDDYINELRRNTKLAENFFAEKLAFTLGPVELTEMMKKNAVKLIDVRYPDDYYESHIPGAISIPKHELQLKLPTLSKHDIHVVYCYNQQCHLGASAALFLAKNDYPVMELEGGFRAWKHDFKLETTT